MCFTQLPAYAEKIIPSGKNSFIFINNQEKKSMNQVITNSNSTLKLYGGTRSRASIIQWYLEEINLDYNYILIDMTQKEHLQSPFLELNPFGKVPVIVDDDFQLWESGAILLYLAEKYGNEINSLEEKSIINQWILFANSTLATGLFIEANREKEMSQLLPPLENILQKNSYLLGENFTVADVAVGSMLAYTQILLKLDLSNYPAITNYIQRIIQRPAFMNTIGKR
ncbi:glutathione S-transferase family protein [Geminocystis sp.]|uniref:glutathione S-transferase family protein n=1 Tax=Geminocystis sp. TaxID=2664100 RepID=UPI0035942795